MDRLKAALGRIGNEDGMALVVTLMMLTLVTVLGFAAILLSSTDVKIAGNERTAVTAQYAAEAALADGVRFLNVSSDIVPDPAESSPNWAKAGSGKAGIYNYTYNIYLKPDIGNFDNNTTTKVVLYNQNFQYSKAPKNNTFPVIVVNGTATTTSGYKASVELEITRFVIPVDTKIRGAVTANGNIDVQGGGGAGDIKISGYDHQLDGSTFANLTTNQKYGVSSSMNVTVQADSNVTGTGGDGSFVKYDTSQPPIKDVAEALGMTGTDWNDYVASGAVHTYTGGTGPTDAEFAAGGVFYVQLDAGVRWGPQINGNGILIVHNPNYVPEQWRVSVPGSVGYDTTSPYYKASLDVSSAGYDSSYANTCKPAVMGNINGGSNFKGVIIADIIDKFDGSFNMLGAVVALDSLTVDTSQLQGAADIKYSSQAISKYATNTKNVSKKLSWRKSPY